MCLVRMKVEHEEDETPSPPRRIVIHPVSEHGSSRIIVASSRPVSRSHSHRSSQRSSRIISVVDPVTAPAPRPSNYILSHTLSAPSTSAATPTTARVYDYRRSSNLDPRASIPRIIHAAPSPPRSIRLSSNNNSPRVSHTSIHSSHSSRRNSISGAGNGNSPRGSRTRIVSENGEIVYVSTERERGSGTTDITRRRSARGSSGQFLTTAAAAMAMTGGGTAQYDREDDDIRGYAEPARRQNIFLDDRDRDDGGGSRIRSRSITYATTGARLSRERVLVEEGGRRREIYQVVGGP